MLDKEPEWQQHMKVTERNNERGFALIMLIFFGGISAGAIHVLAEKSFSIDSRQDWAILGGAVVGPIFSFYAAMLLAGKETRAGVIMKWLFLGPLALAAVAVAIGLLIWAGVSIHAWFQSIPDWAGVIIGLLFLLLLASLDRRR